MKSIRMIALLLIAAFIFGLFFAGCTKNAGETAPTAAPTEDGATEAPASEAPEAAPVRMKNGGALSFLPEEPISVPKLSEMVYTRPDAETLIAEYEALTEKAAACEDAQGLLNDYYQVAVDDHNFQSMYELAYFRFAMDTGDDHCSDEYDYCDEQSAIITEKKSALFAAFAASPCRDALEQAYFGEGFFEDYDEFSDADETYYDLVQQENDLRFRYYSLLEDASFNTDKQLEQNHETFGDIFIELVKVRGQIAAAKGFDNYMDYCYATTFKRDYSTALTWDYLDLVKEKLAPLMQDPKIADDYAEYSYWSESKSMDLLSSAAEKMGDPVLEAFEFMTDRELYDISYKGRKLNIGYTDYIFNYEAPIIFIDPSGRDLLITLFHEFGHYTDYYCNYGFSGDYEIAETYSQAMQYLAFAYAEPFTDSERAENLRATLSDLLVYSILRQAAFAEFEMRVYSLEPEELTLERLDAIYGQCIEDYGISDLGAIWTNSMFWIAYSHFVNYPGYVISYSVSAVASLQICRMEAEETGAGVEGFIRLLGRTHGNKFMAVLEEAELDSPFEAETMEKTAEFLKEVFGQN